MCLDENTLKTVNEIFLLLSIALPLFFIMHFFYNKKRKKQLKYYLLALIFIILIIFLRGEIMNINICKSEKKENPTTNTTTSKIVPANSDNYVGKTSKGYIIEKIDGAYYIDDYLIVNKTYPLSENFIPQNTYHKINEQYCKLCINNEAYTNWLRMTNDATSLGLNIYIASGYRSYDLQKDIYNGYVNKDGKELADTYSARAGHSEHQSGLAFDLNSIDSSFAATNKGKWVNDNAHLYGFIIRYPKDKTYITGYKYEPWHLRYVGLDLAKKLYNKGDWTTIEEYFGINSQYQ